ncbi:MAG: choice-of-anchor D domain-containing protein [Rhodothermales bacterium]
MRRPLLVVFLVMSLTGSVRAAEKAAITVVNDAYTLARGGVLEVPAPGVLGNDTGAYLATVVTSPAVGTLTLSPDGGFTYAHDGSAGSTVTFTYAAGDGSASATGTVTITLVDPSFTRSQLTGHTLTLPSSLQFGPDNRLYALRKLGHVEIMVVQRTAANTYQVASEEIVTLVRSIPNHDDDGYPNTGEKNRQATGILVAGTASNPIVYVSSSDPRVGGGSNEPDTWLDTNSGVVSKLTWMGSSRTDPAGFWEKVDLVRGLPRSEENHASNGLQLSLTGDTLFVASGGFTNAGAPSTNLVYINEYALSGAILSIDLPAIEAMPTKTDANGQKYKYDLPTLDDPTRPNVNGITDPSNPAYNGIDVDDPWGGNDGLNQAKLVAGGPVQIYSPGYRNAYDLLIQRTPGREGRMYTIDNGANRGWGGHPVGEQSYPGALAGTCTNNYDPTEPGSLSAGPHDPTVNNENGLHYIRTLKPGDENYAAPGEKYYAGHPNPIRANPAGAGLYTGDYNADAAKNTGVWRDGTNPAKPLPVDWPPVPVSMANPAECDFRNSGETDGALHNFTASTNGLAEYRSSNFNNLYKGDILAAGWNFTHIYRIRLNEAGDEVLNPTAIGTDIFAQDFGNALLDVTTQGDADIFPGTVWVADFSGHQIYVFEPSDYGQAFRPLAASASRISFGATPTGGTSVRTLTLSNPNGNAALTVSSITKTGTHAGDFSLSTAGPITIAPGATATVTLTFAPGAVGDRSAQVVLNHDGGNGPTRVDLVGAGTDGSEPATVLFRVNAGGYVAFDGGDVMWEPDQAGAPHPYGNGAATGDATYGTPDAVSLDPSVPAGTPAGVFQAARLDAPSGENLQWDIPVAAGKTVEVRFYLSEPIFTAPNVPSWAVWPRTFGIRIDGVTPVDLATVDLFKEAGHDVGLVKSVVVTSDGHLDIDLLPASGDPIVQGIEVVELHAPWAAYRKGWNLVGLPTDPASGVTATVFTEVAPQSSLYLWNGSAYAETATLTPGGGYWLDLGAMRAQTFAGTSLTSLNLSLQAGWNLISGPNCAFDRAAISDPGGILVPDILFGFDGAYVRATTMRPGHGYWVLATAAGGVSLTCGAGKTVAAADEEPAGFGVLTASSADGRAQTLYFGGALEAGDRLDRYALPPRTDRAAFDARFATDRWLETAREGVIRLSGDAPVRFTVAALPPALGQTLLVEELGVEGVLQRHALQAGDAIDVDVRYSNRLRVQALETAAERPEAFALHGNYPNPFNPTTHIVFDLPDAALVDVRVFDLLGHEVLAVPAQTMDAGAGRTLRLDASSLASGVYVYRLTVTAAAGIEARSGRFVLLR